MLFFPGPWEKRNIGDVIDFSSVVLSFAVELSNSICTLAQHDLCSSNWVELLQVGRCMMTMSPFIFMKNQHNVISSTVLFPNLQQMVLALKLELTIRWLLWNFKAILGKYNFLKNLTYFEKQSLKQSYFLENFRWFLTFTLRIY